MTRFMNLLHPTMDMKGVPRKDRTFNFESNKVRKWITGTFNKAKKNLSLRTPDGSRITSFKGVQSGPAFQLSIDIAGGHHVDLDLVAAISFEPSNFQTIPEIW